MVCKKRTGDSNVRSTQIPNATQYDVLICDFIRQCRLNLQRVTALQILHFLIEQNADAIPEDGNGLMKKSGLLTGLGCVQRYLRRKGFVQGRGKDVQ